MLPLLNHLLGVDGAALFLGVLGIAWGLLVVIKHRARALVGWPAICCGLFVIILGAALCALVIRDMHPS